MTKLSLFLNRMRTQAEHSFGTILYLENLHKKGNLCHSTVATLGKLVIWGSSNGRKRKQVPLLLFGMVVMRIAALFIPIGHLPPFNFESQPVRSFLPSHTFLRTFNGKRIIFNLISLNPFDFKDYVTQ